MNNEHIISGQHITKLQSINSMYAKNTIIATDGKKTYYIELSELLKIDKSWNETIFVKDKKRTRTYLKV